MDPDEEVVVKLFFQICPTVDKVIGGNDANHL